MNRLELAQEIYEKQKKLQVKINDHIFCVQDHYKDGIRFSAWNFRHQGAAPMFDADLNLIKDNDYPESIDEARAALKEFLEEDV